jgi:hypothetical protein
MLEFLKSKIRFDAAGYYLLGVLMLVFLGFWPSYFAKFFDGSLNYSGYFHFHAIIVLLWMAVLITQPILIRNKKFAIHRTIGKSTYVLFPLIIISVVLLSHSQSQINEVKNPMGLFITFKDLITLSVAYAIAIRYRKNIEIHARGMIATGIIFIEPALARFSGRNLDIMTNFHGFPYLFTMLFMYVVLVILIIAERKRKSGRWVFPLMLGLLILVQSIWLFQIQIGPWIKFQEWFISL